MTTPIPSPAPAAPTLELLPLHAALVQGQSVTLDVLVRVSPPSMAIDPQRTALNLSLVVDRSGSMSGNKIRYAREAAAFAVNHLLPCDRVSVVIFDDRIDTLVPSTLATDKTTLLKQIQAIQARGSTALHGGWVEGGTQVSQYLNPDQLNRVILLSDGLANVGESRPDRIANDVHGLAQRGVSTTTLGIGDHYSEDLLMAMARSGDGNFVHIESPDQIPAIFETELAGLSATLGQRVSLGLEPQAGVRVLDVLNDLEQTDTGRYKLPNLMVGAPLNLVVRLQVPAQNQAAELLRVRLAWDAPDQPQRQVLRAGLALPLVLAEEFSDFPAQPEVQEQVTLLMAARARREAIALSDQGDMRGARARLHDFSQSLDEACLDMPLSAPLAEERAALTDLSADFDSGAVARARKKAMSQAYNLDRRGQAKPKRPQGE